jgi:hypothetical protein
VATTLTFVGEILQGSLTNTLPIGQYVIRSSIVPQADTPRVLGIPAEDGDILQLYRGSFSAYVYDALVSSWVPNEPTIGVGESGTEKLRPPKPTCGFAALKRTLRSWRLLVRLGGIRGTVNFPHLDLAQSGAGLPRGQAHRFGKLDVAGTEGDLAVGGYDVDDLLFIEPGFERSLADEYGTNGLFRSSRIWWFRFRRHPCHRSWRCRPRTRPNRR